MDQFIKPLARVSDRAGFDAFHESTLAQALFDFEHGYSAAYHGEPRVLGGYCFPCRSEADFVVDMQWGGEVSGGRSVPNWRERLSCPKCELNNRQRLIASLLIELFETGQAQSAYFMEQITPIFRLFRERFAGMQIVGSEFLGDYPSGTVVDGLRHENVENLSFDSGSMDLIVSTDVFEHVADPLKGFAECARVLRPGGELLASFPFYPGRDESLVRAKLTAAGVEHLHSPVYHGNPLSEDGSLVFTDFGWDILEGIRDSGFAVAEIELYRSIPFGHLGGCQVIFRCKTPGSKPAAPNGKDRTLRGRLRQFLGADA